MILILMGVAGSGKTTVGTLLAEQMGILFADADDFHPPANKKKMRAGHPLNDDDRVVWLDILNGLLRNWLSDGTSGVLACSALKEKYRSALQREMPVGALTFCLLDGSREMIQARMSKRQHEYMNPTLLDSQFATLERPSPDRAYRVMNDRTPSEVAAEYRRVPASESAPRRGSVKLMLT